MRLEKDVESYLGTQAERLCGRCVKFIPDIDNGFPDRILMLPGGVLIWVELKNGVGEETRKLQRMQHRKLRKLGQRVEVIRTKEEVDSLLLEFR